MILLLILIQQPVESGTLWDCSFLNQSEDGMKHSFIRGKRGSSARTCLAGYSALFVTGCLCIEGMWQGGSSLESHKKIKISVNAVTFLNPSIIHSIPVELCENKWVVVCCKGLSPACQLTDRYVVSVWISDLLTYVVLSRFTLGIYGVFWLF